MFIRAIRFICLIRDSDIFRLRHNPNPITHGFLDEAFLILFILSS